MLCRAPLASRRIGSCKLKIGVEKRDADDFAFSNS